MFDFANLLFSGTCNARCPFCIGKQIDPRLNQPNLRAYPPRNLEGFIEAIQHNGIRQVVFTGTNADPQIYRHEARLLEYMRQLLGGGVQFSLHTNGRLALRKMDILNLYDRACISFPSFDAEIYQRVMGVPHPPDLQEIVRQAQVPLKVSCVLTAQNLPELAEFLERVGECGIRRVVLRKLFGDRRAWSELLDPVGLSLQYQGEYRGNPVYDYHNMQVTLWDFDHTTSRSLNLFSSGLISEEYLLVRGMNSTVDTGSWLESSYVGAPSQF